MPRVLFVAVPEKGHLHPMIGPAQRLRDAGDAVAFWAAHDVSDALARAGLDAFLGPRTAGPAPDANRGARFAAQVADARWLRGWIRSLLVDAAPDAVEPLREVIRAWRPDVVALDPMVYAAVLAASLERVPWAALSNSLNPCLPDDLDSELLATVRELSRDRDALFARYGLRADFRGCDALSPHLTVAFATRELVGRDVLGVHLVGPSFPVGARGDEVDFPWGRLRPERPLVYMSLGSQIYHQPAMFRAVIEATAGRDVDLVVAASDLATSGELGPLPDHVTAVRYAPQRELLARARAFVTHGGANSVMEAAAAGVPTLVSPICNDQFHNARFVARAGSGVALDLRAASREAVGAALDALLADGPLRERARAVAASYQRDGAAEAARLVRALANPA
ncbi:MAG: glycosyltransferase [Polyangiales bacterium]